MSTFDYTPVAEGNGVLAADLADEFEEARLAINSLDIEAIERHSLDVPHLPSLENGQSTFTSYGPTGSTAVTEHQYNAVYPGAAVAAGWDVLGVPSVGAPPAGLGTSEIILASPVILGATGTADRLRGMFIELDIEVAYATVATVDVVPVFAIQIRDTGGTWYNLAKTVRYIMPDLDSGTLTLGAILMHLEMNASIATLVHAATVTTDLGLPSNTQFDRVRAVVSMKNGDGVLDLVALKRYTFSILTLRSEVA